MRTKLGKAEREREREREKERGQNNRPLDMPVTTRTTRTHAPKGREILICVSEKRAWLYYLTIVSIWKIKCIFPVYVCAECVCAECVCHFIHNEGTTQYI